MEGSIEPGREHEHLTWEEKVIGLHRQLSAAAVPYAFGGAIALNYHRDPRSTLDIDINIFLDPSRPDSVQSALSALPPEISTEGEIERLARDGQTRLMWAGTYVDLFFADTAFHRDMSLRAREEDFATERIKVLSIEDLLICKVLFDRPKDWEDIQAVAAVRAGQLDVDYMVGWLNTMFGEGNDHAARLRRAL